MKFRRARRYGLRIDPTPLTDVIFNLILFLMLGATFSMYSGIPLKLPSAKKIEPQNPSSLIITITRENEIYLEDKKLTFLQLTEELGKRNSQAKPELLIIKADKAALHGTVVKVLDISRSLGIERLAIATEPEEEK